MLRAALFLSALAILSACGKKEAAAPKSPSAQPPIIAAAPVSDELPGLAAPATGIAFWDHPASPYNGLMLVAGENGVVAYNMEDGNPVGAIDGVSAQGVAVSYFGVGAQAAGLAAVLDADANTFRFYGVDNASRAFLPLSGDIAMAAPVRSFCLGRAMNAQAPVLFAVQSSEVRLYNLAPAPGGVAIASDYLLTAPDDAVSCAVDDDGVLLLAGENGALYRVVSDDPYSKPFAKADVIAAGDLEVVNWTDDSGAQKGLILLADRGSGALAAFDRDSGALLGAVSFTSTAEAGGVDQAPVFGAAGFNLGALYRNGAVAFAASAEDGPSIRLAPLDAVLNALAITAGEPASPRGGAAAPEETGIIMKTNFEPGQ